LSQLNDEFTRLAAAVLPSVVTINTTDKVPVAYFGIIGFDEQAGVGSGVIVSKEGHIITNFHVIERAQKGQVITQDGKAHPAEVVGVDRELDIAVLRITDGAEYHALNFADSDKARTGELVFAVGNPLGLAGSVTQGIISATQRRFSDSAHDMIQTDTVINPGNSGGPLVNIRGEVVGINTAIQKADARVNAWQGVGLAVPSNDVRAALEAILTQRTPQAGYLGVSLDEKSVLVTAPSSPGKQFNGSVIAIVAPDSPAQRAGVQPGDVIILFDGKAFSEPFQLMRAIRRARVGETKDFDIIRGDRRMTITVTFGSRPKGP
jgi:S1-C subfamily serine protease